jgi:hypothetical protein
MRPQSKPERWMCLPTSFAMVLDIPVAHLLTEIGHDGSEIIYPELLEPAGRRGFHIQELIEPCLWRNFAVTPIEIFPVSEHAPGRSYVVRMPPTFTDESHWARLAGVIGTTQGVIEGRGPRCGHAVAYDHGMVYDPDPLRIGAPYRFSRVACELRHFIPLCAWRIDPIDLKGRQ